LNQLQFYQKQKFVLNKHANQKINHNK